MSIKYKAYKYHLIYIFNALILRAFFNIMVIVFFLLGSIPLITALIGFIVFSSPQSPQVAGVSNFEKKIVKTDILIPTNTPTSSPAPTMKPTVEPTKEEVSHKNQGPTLTVKNQNNNIDLLQQINQFRTSKGLAILSANNETCFFANIRAQEIVSSFNHDGFRNRIDGGSLPYPSFSEVAENIAMNSDPNQVVPGWINSPGHNDNLSKNVPFGCVVGSGAYYVFEAWKP